jgi:hypothetical protein
MRGGRPSFGVGQARSSADTTTVRVRYAIGGILVAAVLALPASAAAGQGGQVSSLAAQQCSHERAAIGKKAFRKKYGTKHTMRNCAKRNRTQVVTAIRTANDDCQAELAEIGAANFVEEYGDDPTDSVDYAMEECVSESIDELLNPDDDPNDVAIDE